jgi:hypothetical protein
MEASAAGTPSRGQVGRETFDAVQALVVDGRKRTEAFAIVAERTGRSAATVATAYYRVARATPGHGGVRLRPRRAAPARSAAARRPRAPRVATTEQLVRDVLDAAHALARHAERLEEQLDSSQRASASWDELRRFVESR